MDIFLIDTSGHLANPQGGPDILRQQALEAAAAAAAAEGEDAQPAAPSLRGGAEIISQGTPQPLRRRTRW